MRVLDGRTLLGREVPRMWTRPLRPLTEETSLGFEVIEFARDTLGIELHPWQRWWLIHALELLPDGNFRFRVVLLLVARQNGKSLLLQVLSLWRMYVDGGRLVLGTAQNLDVAEEQWAGAVDIAREIDELAEGIDKVVETNGKKALRLVGGERYKVQAANRRGGRGLSGDLVILDELREHQNWSAWAAIVPTTNARERAQVIGASNAGDLSSVVLAEKRKAALDAIDDGSDAHPDNALGLFEWSAEDGCALDDLDGLAQANPSLGYTVTLRALLSDARAAATGGKDQEWVFRTEILCQWRPTAADGPFDPGEWAACASPAAGVVDGAPVAAVVEVSWDRSQAHVLVCGRGRPHPGPPAVDEDGAPIEAPQVWHVEVAATRAGTDWVAGWVKERRDRFVSWTVQKSAPAEVLAGEIEKALTPDGESKPVVPVTVASGSDAAVACGALFDAVHERALSHLGDRQPVLDAPAGTAVTKPVGSMWVIDRARGPVDSSPLMGAALALQAARNAPRQSVSAYEDDGELVIA